MSWSLHAGIEEDLAGQPIRRMNENAAGIRQVPGVDVILRGPRIAKSTI